MRKAPTALYAAMALAFFAAWAASPALAAPDAGGPTDAAAMRAEGARVAEQCAACACPCECARWKFEATLPIWIPGVSGTFASGNSSFDSSGGGSLPDSVADRIPDIIGDLEFAFVGRLHAEHGKWGFTAEGFGVSLGTAIEFRNDTGETGECSAWIVRADASYRLVDCPSGCDDCCRFRKGFTLDAYAGARYFTVDLDLSTAAGGHIKPSEDWIDPIVGLRSVWQFAPRWSLLAEADVGGFGVGAEFAWWVEASVRYRISNLVSVEAGWTVLRENFHNDSFEWNITLSGPRLGITFHF